MFSLPCAPSSLRLFPVIHSLVLSLSHVNAGQKKKKNNNNLDYGVVDGAGRLVLSEPIDLPFPVMMHDMAITRKYSLVFDMNLRFDLSKGFGGAGEGTGPWKHRRDVNARFGVFPRHRPSEIVWIEVGRSIPLSCALPTALQRR